MDLQGRTIAITGAGGFIGGRMVERDFFGHHARWLGKGRILTLSSLLLRPAVKKA